MFADFLWAGLARRRQLKAEAKALYGALVHQARQPGFYAALGVPDSFDGRFDLLTLHAYLLFRHLRGQGEAGARLAQTVFDTMFADMDAVLREQGVGDLSVGRKIRGMAEAFYGRAKAYDEALAAGEGALAETLARNVWRGAAGPAAALPLARYVKAAEGALGGCGLDSLKAGRPAFPPPEPVPS